MVDVTIDEGNAEAEKPRKWRRALGDFFGSLADGFKFNKVKTSRLMSIDYILGREKPSAVFKKLEEQIIMPVHEFAKMRDALRVEGHNLAYPYPTKTDSSGENHIECGTEKAAQKYLSLLQDVLADTEALAAYETTNVKPDPNPRWTPLEVNETSSAGQFVIGSPEGLEYTDLGVFTRAMQGSDPVSAPDSAVDDEVFVLPEEEAPVFDGGDSQTHVVLPDTPDDAEWEAALADINGTKRYDNPVVRMADWGAAHKAKSVDADVGVPDVVDNSSEITHEEIDMLLKGEVEPELSSEVLDEGALRDFEDEVYAEEDEVLEREGELGHSLEVEEAAQAVDDRLVETVRVDKIGERSSSQSNYEARKEWAAMLRGFGEKKHNAGLDSVTSFNCASLAAAEVLGVLDLEYEDLKSVEAKNGDLILSLQDNREFNLMSRDYDALGLSDMVGASEEIATVMNKNICREYAGLAPEAYDLG
jgi:hypothetical protein